MSNLHSVYNILPEPKSIKMTEGAFSLSDICILIEDGIDARVIKKAAELKAKIFEKTGKKVVLSRALAREKAITIAKDASLSSEGYSIEVTTDGIKIAGGDDAGCFYGIVTLLEMLETEGTSLPCVIINDAPDMSYRGFYFDATRGRVPSIEGAKKLILRLAKSKVNVLQFYVEHTFDFKEFYSVDRTDEDYLTADDILELDAFCYDNFIDFQPSISTFGHLFELLMLKEHEHLRELEDYTMVYHFWENRMFHHTIDADNPESVALICSMIDQYMPLFRSKYFNICCDETFDLCKGRNQGKDATKLYVSYVQKITKHITDAGKKVMMWGDIALQHPDMLEFLPKDTILLNWNYAANPDITRIEKVKDCGFEQIVCPGTSSWSSLVELTMHSVPNIMKLAKGGYDNGAIGILNTCWGDYGHPAHPECCTYGIVLGACVAWNKDTRADEDFEKKVSRIYYKSDNNIIALINDLALSHLNKKTLDYCSNTYLECYMWYHHKKIENFKSTVEEIEESLNTARSIRDSLRDVKGDEELLRCLRNSADGIVLLNEVALEVKTNGVVSKAWHEAKDAWLEEFKNCWLLSSKRSELMNIYEFFSKM